MNRPWLAIREAACMPLVIAGASLLAAPAHAEPAAPPDTSVHAITLEEAVALAQQNAPQILRANGQERTADAAVRSAAAAFLPSVSVSASASRRRPSSGARTVVENGQVVTLSDGPWSLSMGLGVDVVLFDGGARIFDLRRAQASAAAAAVNATTQRYAATLAVKQQYFNVLAARESERAARAQLDQAEQQLRTSVARVRERIATRSDSLRAAIQVRSGRLAVMDARNSLASANAALTRAAGAPYPVTASAADSLMGTGIAIPDRELLALVENAPAVRQAAAALTAATAARRSAWTSYLPSLSAGYSRSGNATAATFTPASDIYSYSGSVRLSLSLPLFDKLQREERVTQARVAEENAAAALRDARLAARESMVALLGTFRSAEEKVAMHAATVEAAREDLTLQQERYALGASTLLDVLTSETQLDQARRDLIRARYDRRTAKAAIESLLGRDL